jgi:CTP synthase
MRLSGLSPDDNLVEYIELIDHPYFVATQAHPEFRSRPDDPHPLFVGLVEAAARHRSELIVVIESSESSVGS